MDKGVLGESGLFLNGSKLPLLLGKNGIGLGKRLFLLADLRSQAVQRSCSLWTLN